MFCRAAWQRLAPLARKSLTPLLSNAVFPIRQMSFGLPASGTNMAYMLIGGSSLTAALVYAYKTINSDSARYNERIAQLEARPKIIQMSDLLSTVKILAGSTGEIAAASVGDQHLVATLRLAEDNNSVEILNGLEVFEFSAEVVEEPVIDRSDLKTEGGELEELPSALQAVEETIEVGDEHVKSEADSPVEAEMNAESPVSSEEASVTEMESILEWEESLSPEVMLSEDDTISGPAEVTSETVKAEGQQIEEDKALCHEHEPAVTETEHSDLTAPPTDLEEALQATTEAAEELAEEMMLDSVEEAKPVKASEEAVESGNVTMTMAQA
ncbi:hypothetical protein PO909_014928 [Leuciscus waleckii]